MVLMVRHGVQTDHIRSSVGRRFRTTKQRTSQSIDLVEAHTERQV